MSKKTDVFENHLERSKEILEKLMDPEITMSESITAYETGMKELQAAQEMLERAQLQVEEIKNREHA
ncbi:MAG: exodeoxyribonuclease VII small subunit [Campylobacterota bacterium]|nr:exodeoxyribonuclease VII small subunit [Campylobacterota bacterium]